MRKWRYVKTTLEQGDIVNTETIVDERHLRTVVFPQWVLQYVEPQESETSFERFLHLWVMSYKATEVFEEEHEDTRSNKEGGGCP